MDCYTPSSLMMFSREVRPACEATFSPCLKTMRVGTDLTPYFLVVSVQSSMSISTTLTWPW